MDFSQTNKIKLKRQKNSQFKKLSKTQLRIKMGKKKPHNKTRQNKKKVSKH